MPLGVKMTYAPTKKTIVFTDDVKNDPHFVEVMEVVKACADTAFKAWLIKQTPIIAKDVAESQDISDDKKADLKAISANLSELVGRTAPIDDGVIHDCKALFSNEPAWQVVSLLAKITGFLLNVQRFEKQLAAIDRDIESGVMARQIAGPLTRDGSPPSYIPRSRQTNGR